MGFGVIEDLVAMAFGEQITIDARNLFSGELCVCGFHHPQVCLEKWCCLDAQNTVVHWVWLKFTLAHGRACNSPIYLLCT